jgi:hypothetical protein
MVCNETSDSAISLTEDRWFFQWWFRASGDENKDGEDDEKTGKEMMFHTINSPGASKCMGICHSIARTGRLPLQISSGT